MDNSHENAFSHVNGYNFEDGSQAWIAGETEVAGSKVKVVVEGPELTRSAGRVTVMEVPGRSGCGRVR